MAYSPKISEEKIVETTCQNIERLTETPEGKKILIKILDNYANNIPEGKTNK